MNVKYSTCTSGFGTSLSFFSQWNRFSIACTFSNSQSESSSPSCKKSKKSCLQSNAWSYIWYKSQLQYGKTSPHFQYVLVLACIVSPVMWWLGLLGKRHVFASNFPRVMMSSWISSFGLFLSHAQDCQPMAACVYPWGRSYFTRWSTTSSRGNFLSMNLYMMLSLWHDMKFLLSRKIDSEN